MGTPYNVSDAALPTRSVLDRSFLRSSVTSASVITQGPLALTMQTTAQAKRWRKLSSADAAMFEQQGLKEGAQLTGTLVAEAVSDTCIRIRYALGNSVPDNRTAMVVGRLAPATAQPAASPAIVGFSTRALRLSIDPQSFRIEIRSPDGRLITGIGGSEKNAFNVWDQHALGVSLRGDGRQMAHEAFDLRPGEAVYGLGERFGPRLDLVGQTVELWNRDALGTTTPRAYKNIPFLVTTGGWGVFFNHSCAATAWVGSLSSCDLQVALDEEFIDYYVFVGDIATVLGEYTALTGRGQTPPAWTFGYWQSKISYTSAAETLDIAQRLRAARIPCDVIHLDTFWFERDWYCNLEFARERFPDPAAYFAELRRLGFRVCLWQLPYIPEGCRLYDELLAVNGFVRNAAGAVHDCGICFTPGFSGTVGVIDFTNPQAVALWTARLRHLFSLGAAVIKTDFGEDAPADGVWHDGTPAHRMHNLYPLLYNLVAAEATRAGSDGGQVWHRSAWAGSQRHPVPWGGDNSPNFHNLAPQMRGGLSLGLSGFTFWSQDIGGFLGDTNDHLLLRWLQAGLFLSHSRIHGCGLRELDRFAPATVEIARRFLELRYRLLPYILAQSVSASARGLPMMRALVVEFQDDRNTWQVDDQWLFGSDLLVAPILDAGDTRQVYLPPGTWYDWWDGTAMPGGRWITTRAGLERLPLWLRAGGIVPLGDVHQWTGEAPDRSIDLLLAPLDADGQRTLDCTINGVAVRLVLRREGQRQVLSHSGCPTPIHPRFPAGCGQELRVERLP
jgi:alpha-D-xyloside xylohydrolase